VHAEGYGKKVMACKGEIAHYDRCPGKSPRYMQNFPYMKIMVLMTFLPAIKFLL
jgi:hypothetical protein